MKNYFELVHTMGGKMAFPLSIKGGVLNNYALLEYSNVEKNSLNLKFARKLIKKSKFKTDKHGNIWLNLFITDSKSDLLEKLNELNKFVDESIIEIKKFVENDRIDPEFVNNFNKKMRWQNER